MTFDVYPTLLEAAGIENPKDYLLDGESIMPLLKGQQSSLHRTEIFWHFPGYPNNAWRTSPVSVIRSGNWKLMKYYESNRMELFNLQDDIGETENLINSQPEIASRLSQKLSDWLTNTNAPLPAKQD